jgi:tRNA A-37 threonylcarbamoyl transferase component Bud32/membrane-associated phospholipid phosphatase
VWFVAASVMAIGLFAFPMARQPAPLERLDSAILRQLAEVRVAWLTNVARGINTAGSRWGIVILAWSVGLAIAVFRRWRHLFTFLGSYVVLALIGSALVDSAARPRPYDVLIIGRWGGFSMPSPPIAVLSLILVGITYSLVVPGRARQYAKFGIAAVVAILAFARLYLAVDHPSDVVYAVLLGVAIPLIAFRWFTPNEAFPVTYQRGKKAHLDVTGARGDAIRRAIEDQLGLTVLDVKHVGLEGSGGSTPLRLRVAGDPERYVFAKLYAKSHVMADRWYKLGRTILYGALEDEAPFQSVRRLVEYEDYALRVLRDAGIPTAEPYGICEITPEREYILVTGFIDDAEEVSDAKVDESIIDEGMMLIRQLWDAGLAHRDIKPANLLVRDGKMYLIDAFFVQVRPSPWRQAVDLANMMLVLAFRFNVERVYEHALKFFSPEEIAEAFAATRGVASPTQLRVLMKEDRRDLLTEFRNLAPKRRAIAIQQWSPRRFAIAFFVIAVFVLAATQLVGLLSPVQELPITKPAECGAESTVLLMAQAVPSAAEIPCIASLPSGWKFGRAPIHNGRGRFWLDSDRAGSRAVVVTLTARCELVGVDEVGVRAGRVTRFERVRRVPDGIAAVRYERFAGGCARYDFNLDDEDAPSLFAAVEVALAYTPRAELIAHVDDEFGLRLCGRGVPCPG